ncbi:hypothetical protein [Nonomuraea sp. NPDC049158]
MAESQDCFRASYRPGPPMRLRWECVATMAVPAIIERRWHLMPLARVS